jgi:hypothetical protein
VIELADGGLGGKEVMLGADFLRAGHETLETNKCVGVALEEYVYDLLKAGEIELAKQK